MDATSESDLPAVEVAPPHRTSQDAPETEVPDAQEAEESRKLGDEHQEPDSEPMRPKYDLQDLRRPPPHLAYMRQKLFEIKEPIDLKREDFEQYWPFVSNVWICQHKAGRNVTPNYITDYWTCRLQRPTYTPRKSDDARPDGKPSRKKQAREGGTCQVRIKTVFFNGGCRKITILRLGPEEHSHDLDAMDKLKRNTVVMDVARAEVMKGFSPASVFVLMHEQVPNMEEVGGRYLSRIDVRNASGAWRAAHSEPLAVHPGYIQDHAHGTIRVAEPLPAPSNGAAAAPLAKLLLPLPPSTLFFPPASRAFLTPYLPPKLDTRPPDGLPHVTLTYATSMDSFLAIQPGMPTPISGPLSKAMTHYLRSCHDAILIGVGTALADDPSLNCRLAGAGGFGGIGWSHQPRPIIIDPSARWHLTPNHAVLRAATAGLGLAPWIVVAPAVDIDPARLKDVRDLGGKYLGMGDTGTAFRLRWDDIFRALAAEGIRSVLVEGGGHVLNALLQPSNAHLVRAAIVTVAPTYFGVGGVPVAPGRTVDHVGRPVPVARFRDVKWTQLGEDVIMCGRLGSPPAADESGIVTEVHGVDSGIGVDPPALINPVGKRTPLKYTRKFMIGGGRRSAAGPMMPPVLP